MKYQYETKLQPILTIIILKTSDFDVAPFETGKGTLHRQNLACKQSEMGVQNNIQFYHYIENVLFLVYNEFNKKGNGITPGSIMKY